ncbi:MAG: hypothetical protein HY823_03765 [Acidobacteria bacterium]|nr:hypothetical protein [Acidobacteriota bacterium]
MSWDGEFLYHWEILRDWGVKVRTAFSQQTAQGPQWFWSAPVQFSTAFRVLAAASRVALVEERGGKDERGVPQYGLKAVNLIDGESRPLLAKPDPLRTLSAEAVVKDQEFILVMNCGELYHLPLGTHSLRTVREHFWGDLSDKYIQEEKGGPGMSPIPLPPRFIGSGFFGPGGEIYFPLTVRETNTWTQEAMERMVKGEEKAFQSLSKEEQSRRIASGAWPPKVDLSKPFHGSEEVFVLLQYDSEARKISKVPEERLGKLVNADPATGQWKLSGHGSPTPTQRLGWPEIAQRLDGQFVPVEELIQSDMVPGGKTLETPAAGKGPSADKKPAPAQAPRPHAPSGKGTLGPN